MTYRSRSELEALREALRGPFSRDMRPGCQGWYTNTNTTALGAHSSLVTIDEQRNVPMTTSLKVAEVFGKEHKHVMRDIRELDCSEEFRRSNFGLTEMEVQAGPVKRMSPVCLMTRDGFTFLAMGFNGAKVAEVFGKNHRDVMSAIRSLAERGVRNFTQSSYVNLQNKQQPMFLMDRKGFVLLVMGFTGDSALEFKSRYIDEFDRMEQKLREQAAPSFSLPQTLAEALEFAAKQVREKEALAIENAEVRQSLTEMKPKADTYDAVVKSKDQMVIKYLLQKNLSALI